MFRVDNQLFHNGGAYHIKTSLFICSANQCSDFYMIKISILRELKISINVFTPWMNVIWRYVFWTSYARSTYVQCLGGLLTSSLTLSALLFLTSDLFCQLDVSVWGNLVGMLNAYLVTNILHYSPGCHHNKKTSRRMTVQNEN